MAIGRVDVLSENLAAWGIQVLDYEYDDVAVDFQNLMIKVTEKRAATVEGEIKPMSERMRKRNASLGNLGDALAAIADIEAQFESGEKPNATHKSKNLSESAAAGLAMVECYNGKNSDGTPKPYKKGDDLSLTKSDCEKFQQELKTRIDGLNNAASKDMTRLQSLVDKRDESYSTASSLMQSIGDTRANTIKNM